MCKVNIVFTVLVGFTLLLGTPCSCVTFCQGRN